MIFNKHLDLKGQHALFSPSQTAWLRYDDDKILDRVQNKYRAPLGTEIHEFAADQITLSHKVSSIRNLVNDIENYIYCKYKHLGSSLKVSEFGMTLIEQVGLLPKDVFEAVRHYINDGIGYKMEVEQPLYYSEDIFGTADAICYRNKLLRIHDLKTGSLPAKMEQLEAYAALFCLEYDVKPSDISFELRIYHCDGIIFHNPTIEELVPIIDRIVTTDRIAASARRNTRE